MTSASTHSAVEIIRTKRDGGELSDNQIRWFINRYSTGALPHEQASALLMAIVFVGMTNSELGAWTSAMVESGTRVDLSGVGRPTVDKHSTGGVGDKISLPLVPLVAACGAAVPQLSGRGLGHTGGTLDKMASIRGWHSAISTQQFLSQLREVGAVICAAGDDLAPADRALYALRDVTATVESIPLIASSIMSKKIAEGTRSLVLDVKVGSGAFMKDLDGARELANTLVAVGADNGVRTSALITDMWTPLGNTAGNALEVAEAIEVLQGGGPGDVVDLTVELAREMLRLAGLDTVDPADALADGSAMDKWRQMVTAQGGDVDAPLPQARYVETVRAEADGHVAGVDALGVGEAAWKLGAGRAEKEATVSPGAGVRWNFRPGDEIHRGDVLFELHTDDPSLLPGAIESARAAARIQVDGSSGDPLEDHRVDPTYASADSSSSDNPHGSLILERVSS